MQRLEKVIYFANFIVTSVNEALKNEEIENLQKEYKARKKGIEAQFNQKTENIEKDQKLDKDQKMESLKQANAWAEEENKLLDEDFNLTSKELKDLRVMQIITEAEYQEMSLKYGHVFEAGIGAEAVYKLLKEVDVDKEIIALEKTSKDEEVRDKKLINRVKLFKVCRETALSRKI